MPKPRKHENLYLPKCWRFRRNTFYYRVPVKEQPLWGNKTEIRLGKTYDESVLFLKNAKKLIAKGRHPINPLLAKKNIPL